MDLTKCSLSAHLLACLLTSVNHCWCKKFSAKIYAKFSQLYWYYADVGVEKNAPVQFFHTFSPPFLTTLGEVQYCQP